MEFTANQRLFLETIGSYFHEHAEWPTYGYLDRILRSHEELDVEVVGQELEPFMYDDLYTPMSGFDPNRSTFLNISAIYICVSENICPDLAEDLDAFMQAVHLCIEKYLTGNDDNQQITASEVGVRFGMTDLMLRKVFDMVGRANLTGGSSLINAGNPVQWTFTIWQSAIRKYRGVKTIEDFIRVRKEIRTQMQHRYHPFGQSNPAPDPEGLIGATYLDSALAGYGDIQYAANTSAVAQIHPIALFPLGPFIRNEHLCFVLMPFATELVPVYENAIVPAATTAGLECQRADDITTPGGIMAQVWESLLKARVVVADLTNMNANVFYELGLAHTIGHNAILLTQDMEWVPFDLRHMRCVQYQPSEHGLRLLSQKLRRIFKEHIDETATPGADV